MPTISSAMPLQTPLRLARFHVCERLLLRSLELGDLSLLLDLLRPVLRRQPRGLFVVCTRELSNSRVVLGPQRL